MWPEPPRKAETLLEFGQKQERNRDAPRVAPAMFRLVS